jgi:purine-binding chemotaxis protein CheW
VRSRDEALIVRAGGWTCALPLAEVMETMRELPCLPCTGAPTWVRGACIVRGTPTPVVDLAAFLGGRAVEETGRLVTVRATCAVALRVDSVLGIRSLPRNAAKQSSRLLDGLASVRREELATLDGELLSLLDLGTLLPSEFQVELAHGALH